MTDIDKADDTKLPLSVGRATQGSTGKTRDKSRTIPLPSNREPCQLLTGFLTYKANAPDRKSPYPANVVRNQKYSVATFFPLTFYEQFKFFFNFYFLVVALSQFVPALKIGEFSYPTPLAEEVHHS